MAVRHISELESQAIEFMRGRLSRPIALATTTLNLIGELVNLDTPAKLQKAQNVRLLLLERLQNDLRACWILAERGYPLQAAGHAAGVYEAWVNIAAIGGEAAALKWLSHGDERTSFGQVKALTRDAIEEILGRSEPETVKSIYSQYGQLCMPKHLNPIVERLRGYRVQRGEITFTQGPDTSELAVAHGWYSLERGSRFAFFGIVAFVHNEASPLTSATRSDLDKLHADLEALQRESMRLWPESYSRPRQESVVASKVKETE